LVLARGGLFGTNLCPPNGRWRFASQLDPGFALCPAEQAFARQLLAAHTRYWLFRTHQQQAAGDFIAVDRSGKARSSRWFAIELKRAQRLRLGRPGMQLARCGHAIAWVAGAYGLSVTLVTEVVGAPDAVTRLLERGVRV
jgi:hypothetical protein